MHPEHGNDRNTDSQNQQMTEYKKNTNMGNGETAPNSPNRTQIITHSNRTETKTLIWETVRQTQNT